MPKYNLQKNRLKEIQNPSRYYKLMNILAKEELRKLKYFTMPKYNLQKNRPKEIQNPS
jgi:hypothetical protein